MSLKFFAFAAKNWYSRMRPQERRLLIFLCLAIGASVYFNAFLRPVFSEMERLKKQADDSLARQQQLVGQMPDTQRQRQELKKLEEEAGLLRDKVSRAEEGLPGAGQVPQVLSGLIRRAQALGVEIASLKQEFKEGRSGFVRLYVDLKFTCAFEKAAAFIAEVENFLPFARIEEMEIEQSREDNARMVTAVLRLCAVLDTAKGKQGQLPVAVRPPSAKEAKPGKSPFTPRFIVEKINKKKFVLTGITYRGDGRESSAIINGNIVRVGSQIEGAGVEKILPDAVVLNNGAESYPVKLER
jgi:Tfp pilus assembly protein PilO